MSNEQAHGKQFDMLQAIFAMQTELNDYIFRKNGILDNAGTQLAMQTIICQVGEGKLSVNDLPNQWLSRYTKAIAGELAELEGDLLWKWWSKDELNIQNVRVELIDLLHFLVSAMLASGLSAEKVYDIYKQKHAINHARQETGYSQSSKTEDDNRTIK